MNVMRNLNQHQTINVWRLVSQGLPNLTRKSPRWESWPRPFANFVCTPHPRNNDHKFCSYNCTVRKYFRQDFESKKLIAEVVYICWLVQLFILSWLPLSLGPHTKVIFKTQGEKALFFCHTIKYVVGLNGKCFSNLIHCVINLWPNS